MYILGSIINLEDGTLEIPIPWWHRASLGLESSTAVSVSVTEAKDQRPGDLLVSVLNTVHWEKNVFAFCVADDEPGVIEKALSIVTGWNIALAETITLEGGKRHRVELILEPRSEQQKQALANDPARVIQRLRKALRQQFPHSGADCFLKNERAICWNRLTDIKNGWVMFKSKEGHETWRDVINRQLAALKITDDFEVNKLVISGDTDGRLFRAMIPRKGALLVTIEHADDPGTLLKLTATLRAGGVNVLSSLLKRGGATARNARLVAVCEPTRIADSLNLRQEIETRLVRLRTESPELRIEFDFGGGAPGGEVIYSEHLEHIVARVPPTIRARVLELRRSFPRGRVPVFISRRFALGGRAQDYVRKLHDVLNALGCHVVEATIQPGSNRISLTEVSAAMWAAKAGIVLGIEPGERREGSLERPADAFTLNLAHEFGFMQGQGKPLLLLIEDPSTVKEELDKWTNVKGITAPRFSREFALNDKHDESIRAKVEEWYNGISQKK